MLRIAGLLVLLLLATTIVVQVGPVPSYTVTDLGPLPSVTQSIAHGVNDSGTAVGKSEGPVRWTSSAAESLGTLPGANFTGEALDINSGGQIAGWADDTSKNQMAFIWVSGTGMQSLGTLPGDTQSQGLGINDSGSVAGVSSDQGFGTAFLWNGTTMAGLGTLSGGTSTGYAVNNSGWVAGTSDSQAFIWNGTSMMGLGFLSGHTKSTGRDINSSGWAVGTSDAPGVNEEAYFWNGSTMMGLGVLPGDNRSFGTGLNDSGWVVGQSAGTGPVTINGRAFLWDGSQMHDLNTLIVGPNPFTTLRGAAEISNSGLIVGHGALPSGLDHGFLLTPVDPNEPPTADAGANKTVECTGFSGAPVTLDGSASDDPDGDILTFTWTGANGPLQGPTPTPILPLGTYEFTLTVDDGNGGTDTDTVIVTVEDTAPPTINSLTVSPSTLWPPNHNIADVVVTVDVFDLCDTGASCQIVSVTSNEPDSGLGNGDRAGDIEITGDLTVRLRAERSGNGTGRIYTLVVECTDAQANTTQQSVTVTAPKNQGRR